MGRLGSGRKKKHEELLNDLLDSDAKWQEELVVKTKIAFDDAYAYLHGLVTGKAEKEERIDQKTGMKILIKPSHDVRVKAAKVLKEMTLDKALSDKKDRKSDGKGKEEGGLMKALKDAEKLKKAELLNRKKAVKEGKLAEIKADIKKAVMPDNK